MTSNQLPSKELYQLRNEIVDLFDYRLWLESDAEKIKPKLLSSKIAQSIKKIKYRG